MERKIDTHPHAVREREVVWGRRVVSHMNTGNLFISLLHFHEVQVTSVQPHSVLQGICIH